MAVTRRVSWSNRMHPSMQFRKTFVIEHNFILSKKEQSPLYACVSVSLFTGISTSLHYPQFVCHNALYSSIISILSAHVHCECVHCHSCCFIFLKIPLTTWFCYIFFTDMLVHSASWRVNIMTILRRWFFAANERLTLRTSETYESNLRTAVSTGAPAFGIKGTTKLTNFLKIPEGIPFDPMHLLYLGVNKSFLSAIIKYKLVDCLSLATFVDRLSVPHYFRRKPRNILNELCLWKAQEHRVFHLYYAPMVFFCISEKLRDHYSKMVFKIYYFLSTAVYLLSEDEMTNGKITDSEICIDEFQCGLIDLLGDSVKTITLHCLQHLPEQVRRFGLLPTVSAMPFENLNRQLKRNLTGTRGCAEQIVHIVIWTLTSVKPHFMVRIPFCWERQVHSRDSELVFVSYF